MNDIQRAADLASTVLPGPIGEAVMACRGKAKWLLHGVCRCTRHTASVLHDLPVGRAS